MSAISTKKKKDFLYIMLDFLCNHNKERWAFVLLFCDKEGSGTYLTTAVCASP